jgi:hypothetical protein
MVSRIVTKALILFGVINFLYAVTFSSQPISHLSIYNWLVPGRQRLPYGETSESYNLSLNSLEAMFSSHTLGRAKLPNEFRVIVIGDSSVWGILLSNAQTLSGYLNNENLKSGEKYIYVYNIGHPVLSVTKDLMLLEYSMQYKPDLVIWLITLQSLPYPKQLEAPLLQNNAPRVRELIQNYNLHLDPYDKHFIELDFWGKTLLGQRRALADWWRLQLYGLAWANTGIDQIYDTYTARRNDFSADISWQDFKYSTNFEEKDLAFDVLAAGYKVAGNAPLLLINEPIFVADGTNSDLRYNFWYPRWAYDSYRQLLRKLAADNKWHYWDLWNLLPPSEFTDSPVHLSPRGSRQLSETVGKFIEEVANSPPVVKSESSN